jgi:hypothetical protein
MPPPNTPRGSAERTRMEEERLRLAYWTRWGPYVSARQWGTVREDYSADGDAWTYFPHDHARSRAYRWGEDGIFGICDNHQRLCFALALWNGEDPILKERFFGLSSPEGNHGEDVKEYYFYLDNVPTHSYMKALYKYPQRAFPYEDLVRENGRRTKADPEYELLDTGVFADDAYFDVFVEYAKLTSDDVAIAVTAINRGGEERRLHLLPTLWFRNSWSWAPGHAKPVLEATRAADGAPVILARHPELGDRRLLCEGAPELLFTENETNAERLYGTPNATPYVKDGIDERVVHGRREAVNPAQTGTKAAAWYALDVPAGASRVVRLRLSEGEPREGAFGAPFDRMVAQRGREADEFYAMVNPYALGEERRRVQRQAFAGMLWSKQFYHYVVRDWLNGDPLQPKPPAARRHGRNHNWRHLFSDDVLSMPDNWEYPWFASWDLAFHVIPFALIDPEFAKKQLLLLTREWYMHPNGQIPAYEWAFDDVNPPVQAWAALRIYQIEEKMTGRSDPVFLERVFQKLLMNFTWWVNRKDAEGNNVFQGGFLGLDNVGVFDRNAQLPTGGTLDQSDGTSWMGVYCLNLLAIAIELAKVNVSYEDIASKFFEHFLFIADAMNKVGKGHGLWHEEDGFYYDVLHLPDRTHYPLKVRSLVGLIPALAVQTLEPEVLSALPNFARRIEWFMDNRPDLRANISAMETPGVAGRRLLSIIWPEKLRLILRRMLDEAEFLSPHGVRSLSKTYEQAPYVLHVAGVDYVIDYEPAESRTGTFGGNSNWRGPVWFPLNYMLIEALQHFHYYLGDEFLVEYPTGSGNMLTLWEIATELSHRLIDLFDRDGRGRRPVYGGIERFQRDPHWRDHVLFFEYFNGDDGAGLGASHQTGWTGIVAKLLQQCAEYCGQGKHP